MRSRHQHNSRKSSNPDDHDHPIIRAPHSRNWANQLNKHSVRDQGNCGSCWAFASAGLMEFSFKIKNGTNVDLSEQQLMDCSYSVVG